MAVCSAVRYRCASPLGGANESTGGDLRGRGVREPSPAEAVLLDPLHGASEETALALSDYGNDDDGIVVEGGVRRFVLCRRRGLLRRRHRAVLRDGIRPPPPRAVKRSVIPITGAYRHEIRGLRTVDMTLVKLMT